MKQTERQSIKLKGIHATLAEIGARGLGIYDGPNGSELKFYSIKGRVVILQIYGDGSGYEVYAPIENSNSITATIDALRAI